MNQDALKLIHLRNDFYRHNYRRLMFVLVLGFITLLMLASALLYLTLYPPEPRYFAISKEGHLTPLISINKPNLSNAALLQWATQATVSAFNYNYVNYRQALQSIRDNFTNQGWENFSTALNYSNNLSAVIQKKLIVSAVPTGAPVIVEQGLRHGIYAWRVQMPLLVTYQSPSDLIPQSFRIDLLIIRVPTLQSVKGIGIQQLIMTGSGSIRD